MDDQGSRVQFPAGAGNFSLYHHVQNGSGAHPASYPMGTTGSFPGGEADHSPSSSAKVKECMELCLHSHNVPSWHGAQLKNSTGTTYFTFIFEISSSGQDQIWKPLKLTTANLQIILAYKVSIDGVLGLSGLRLSW
jgi:hypothetical protein